MKNALSRPVWLLGAAMLALLVVPTLAHAQDEQFLGDVWEVTITNLTKGQVISPPIAYSHGGNFQLFTPGEPAIPELAGVAEDAMNEPLIAYLQTQPKVLDVTVAAGPLMPGHTTHLYVTARGAARRITALGMLVTTNDAFFAAEGRAIGFGETEYAIAWDAGSEENNESCDYVPGPPCGNIGVRATDNAEGYVYVHAGIHGGSDLDPSMHDWRTPVAKVTLRRAH